MKKLNLLLGLMVVTSGSLLAAVKIGYLFRIDEVANRVSKMTEKPKPWWRFFSRTKSDLMVNGIGLVLAFEKLGIDEPVSPSVLMRYTILDLLNCLDQRVCQDLVAYRREHGYKDWNSFSEEDFSQLNAIQKKYLDALPIVLVEKYGESAKVYVEEIIQARTDFEARNNGCLIERI